MRLRRILAPEVEAGLHRCAAPQCGEIIMPGEEWDLGHNPDGTYAGPEHARCNRAVQTKAVRHSREW